LAAAYTGSRWSAPVLASPLHTADAVIVQDDLATVRAVIALCPPVRESADDL
jgi:hypothetical protein